MGKISNARKLVIYLLLTSAGEAEAGCRSALEWSIMRMVQLPAILANWRPGVKEVPGIEELQARRFLRNTGISQQDWESALSAMARAFNDFNTFDRFLRSNFNVRLRDMASPQLNLIEAQESVVIEFIRTQYLSQLVRVATEENPPHATSLLAKFEALINAADILPSGIDRFIPELPFENDPIVAMAVNSLNDMFNNEQLGRLLKYDLSIQPATIFVVLLNDRYNAWLALEALKFQGKGDALVTAIRNDRAANHAPSYMTEERLQPIISFLRR